ncbi:hypothetical protein LSCM4_00932 [Leishmania orientalis]|uniref:Uncharacterized protein n=1 Tax=Leishmania orientalis TaxID=2249476 RepID=A0A836GZ70_9TRYP|nr:hypothetical protein LSCM4_00932 [Leishmania orientalis]
MTVVFDADALEVWKRQVREVANAGELRAEQVLSFLDSLERIGHTTEHKQAMPLRKCYRDSDPAQMAPPQHTRVSVGTQLWTVHPIHYAHHVLNEVRRERQVKVLSRRLGVLAADLHTVAHDLWKLLQASSTGQPLTAAPTLYDTANTEALDRAASVAAAPCSENRVWHGVSLSTYQTLRSLFGYLPDFDADQLLDWSNRTIPSLMTPASSSVPSRLKRQVDACVQTPQEFVAEQAAADTPGERLLFLCRHCRQDGRAGYQIAEGRMQLTQIHDIGSANRDRGRPPPLTSPALRCTVTRRADHPLSQNGGAHRPRRRMLPDL